MANHAKKDVTLNLDSLDLDLLEVLFDNARIPFGKLAKLVGSDQKTVARRVIRLCKKEIIKRFTVEVDYSKLGLNAMAYIGTGTTIDASIRRRLFEFFEREPRILRVEATMGANEYVFLNYRQGHPQPPRERQHEARTLYSWTVDFYCLEDDQAAELSAPDEADKRGIWDRI